MKEGGEGNGTGEGDAVGGEGGGASSSALCPWQQTRIHCQKHPEIKSGEVSVARRAFGTPSNESVAFCARLPRQQYSLAARRHTSARRRRGKFSVPIRIADFTGQLWAAQAHPHLPWQSNTCVCSSSSVRSAERHPHRIALLHGPAGGARCWENARTGLHGSVFRLNDAH